MNTKEKGSLAVSQCVGKLAERGYEILLPIGDKKPYDLVFDDGLSLQKVQVKYAGRSSRGTHIANLRITGGNQSFNYARKYSDTDFDYLYVFTEDKRHFLIKWKEIKNRNTVVVDDKNYEKYLI